jgi:ferrous iron transport protein A
MTLNQLCAGESGVITIVGGTGVLRRRLLDMGLIPKTTVLMRKMAPLGDPMELSLRGYELTLRAQDAREIQIEAAETQRPKPVETAFKERGLAKRKGRLRHRPQGAGR